MNKLKTLFILLIGILILGILATNVYATEPATLSLNIDDTRPFSDDDGDGQINDKYEISLNSVPHKIFKIGERETQDSLDFSRTLYCLKFGLGFGAGTRDIVSPQDIEYSKYANFKTEVEKITEYYNALGYNIDQTFQHSEDSTVVTFTPYNAILWLADNICLINDNTNIDDLPIQNLLKAANIKNPELTLDDIDVILQCALWHFSEYPDFFLSGANLANLLKINDDNISDISDARYRQAETLYDYLVNEAKKNASSYGTGTTRPVETIDEPTVKLDDTLDAIVQEKSFQIENQESNYYVVGPFKVDITEKENWEIDIETSFGYKSSISQTEYTNINNALLITMQDGEVNEYNYDISKGGEFYIAMSSTEIENTIVDFKVDISYTYSRPNKQVELWTATTQDQPVLLVEETMITGNGRDSMNVDNRKPDFSLRKYITQLERNGQLVEIDSRVPNINTATIATKGTATYKHIKAPVEVKTGDKITYTITVYNEGTVEGKVTEIIDYLPEGISFDVESNPLFIPAKDMYENEELEQYKYSYQILNNKLIIKYLEDYSLAPFEGRLDSREIQIVCTVDANKGATDLVLTNIAEITGYEVKGNLEDRDSKPENIERPTTLDNYWGNEANTAQNPGATNPESYYRGQEDDDDFEKVLIKGVNFDLSLRKFISSVKRNGTEILTDDIIEGRIPKTNTELLETTTTAAYSHAKDAVTVKNGDIVTYTIRVYNEGDVSGYVNNITDHIPEGMEFIIESEINQKYMWQYLTAEDLNSISTSYWSKEKAREGALLNPFSEETLDYVDVCIELKVIAPNTYEKELVNIAEITESVAVNENNEVLNVIDRDSKKTVDLTDYDLYTAPENSTYQEDDDDYEIVRLKYFDLSLHKFITAVDDIEITSRIPKVSYSEEEGLEYIHPKDPIEVVHGSYITYTLRVYNEGRVAGYAEVVSDDIPEGLVYVPEDETNISYKWEMYSENEEGELVKTDNPQEATQIRTTYLSEENGLTMIEEGDNVNPNLINPFNQDAAISAEEPLNPDYRDIQVVFQVDQTAIPEDRIIINHAQISEDSDDDEDSIPDEWNEGEDDQDIEKVHVKEFDLSLLKWVTKTIVTVDGKTTTTETGFKPNIGKTEQTGENIRPNTENEPVAQVVIDKKKLKDTEVKFVYSIKVINEGELPGYATEITDYIPEGLEFVQEDNPIWTKVGEDKITTKALETIELQPGDSEDLEVVFRWINDENNLGAKVNIAAITEDYNDFADTPDVDSNPEDIKTEDYEEEQEDDDDYAIVVLTLKTGGETSYLVLVLSVLAIISTGVLFIKRYVL